jgi:FMN phosphatase YigB (HAD superfamily)
MIVICLLAKGEAMPKTKDALSFDVWKCLVCAEHPEFEKPDFLKHLHEVHKLETKGKPFKQTFLRHYDAQEWFQTDYEIEFEGLKFVNFQRNERAADDMMRFV